jgi:hypothetical protein
VSAPLVENAPSDYDADAVLAAEDQVRDYCGWHIAPSRTETLTLDGTGTAILLLPTVYVTAITSIVENGVTILGTPNYGYTWSEGGLVERIGAYWTWKRRAISITLTHGYPVCPASVRREVARLAAASYATPAPLSQESQTALRPYQLRSF